MIWIGQVWCLFYSRSFCYFTSQCHLLGWNYPHYQPNAPFLSLETLPFTFHTPITRQCYVLHIRFTTVDPSHSQCAPQLISSEMIPATPQMKNCRYYYLVCSFALFFVLSWLVVLPMTFALSWSRYVIFILLCSQTCVIFLNAGQDKDAFGLSKFVSATLR